MFGKPAPHISNAGTQPVEAWVKGFVRTKDKDIIQKIGKITELRRMAHEETNIIKKVRSSVRHGLRPKAKSAMGGIAYLEHKIHE